MSVISSTDIDRKIADQTEHHERAASGGVSLRLRSGDNPGSMPLEQALVEMKEAITSHN